MQIIEMSKHKANIQHVEEGFDFARECGVISAMLLEINPIVKYDLRETENQLRVDFLNDPTEHPFFITIQDRDRAVEFARLKRKINSLTLGGSAA